MGYKKEETKNVKIEGDIEMKAKTKKLKVKYTLESTEDLSNESKPDMADELVKILSSEIAESIDRDIIRQMKRVHIQEK